MAKHSYSFEDTDVVQMTSRWQDLATGTNFEKKNNIQSKFLIHYTPLRRKSNFKVRFQILVINYRPELFKLSNSNTVTPMRHDLGSHHTGQLLLVGYFTTPSV
jgi:hypothetical protein